MLKSKKQLSRISIFLVLLAAELTLSFPISLADSSGKSSPTNNSGKNNIGMQNNTQHTNPNINTNPSGSPQQKQQTQSNSQIDHKPLRWGETPDPPTKVTPLP